MYIQAVTYVHMYLVTSRECYLQVPFLKDSTTPSNVPFFSSWLIKECLPYVYAIQIFNVV